MEQVYKGVTPSINTIMADSKRDSYTRKYKGGESAFPTNPKNVRTGKCKRKRAGLPSNALTSDNTRSLHLPGHSTEE